MIISPKFRPKCGEPGCYTPCANTFPSKGPSWKVATAGHLKGHRWHQFGQGPAATVTTRAWRYYWNVPIMPSTTTTRPRPHPLTKGPQIRLVHITLPIYSPLSIYWYKLILSFRVLGLESNLHGSATECDSIDWWGHRKL